MIPVIYQTNHVEIHGKTNYTFYFWKYCPVSDIEFKRINRETISFAIKI